MITAWSEGKWQGRASRSDWYSHGDGMVIGGRNLNTDMTCNEEWANMNIVDQTHKSTASKSQEMCNPVSVQAQNVIRICSEEVT